MQRKFTIVIHQALPYDEYKNLNSTELSERVRKIIKSKLNWESWLYHILIEINL